MRIWLFSRVIVCFESAKNFPIKWFKLRVALFIVILSQLLPCVKEFENAVLNRTAVAFSVGSSSYPLLPGFEYSRNWYSLLIVSSAPVLSSSLRQDQFFSI